MLETTLRRLAWVGALALAGCPNDDAAGGTSISASADGSGTEGTGGTPLTTGASGASAASSITASSSATTGTEDESTGGSNSDATTSLDTSDTEHASDSTESTESTDSFGRGTGSTGDSSSTTAASSASTSTGAAGGSSSSGSPDVGYADCTVLPAACLPDEVCVVDAPVDPAYGVCAREPCAGAFDCPDPPPGGNAIVTCGDFTGGAADECYLSCFFGETCPTGMECWSGTACVWPGTQNPDVGYGDCVNQVPLDGCLGYETCLFDNPMNPTVGVCGVLDCDLSTECPTAPPGGTAEVVCDDITADMIDDCFVDCSGGATCPTGMSCALGFLCAWDLDPAVQQEGFGDCLNNDAAVACWPDEQCLSDNPAAPTVAACSEGPCALVTDCRLPPPGGTAPVACSDVTGDAVPECHIDCSGGGTCPTGMNCFGGFICLWP